MQYVEFVDRAGHNSLLHRFTLYDAGRRVHADVEPGKHTRPRLKLETQLFGCAPLPRGCRATNMTNISRSGRSIIAASASRTGEYIHSAFSVKDVEDRQSDTQVVVHCTSIELKGVMKGYSLEVEPYSGAVLYTLAREEAVVIQYFD